MSQVKTLFPMIGSSERKYLVNLSKTIQDYCLEENVSTLEEIYDGFGRPNEVVNVYVSNIDTSKLIKRIKVTKWIKVGIIILLLISLIGVSVFGITIYKEYKIYQQEQIYFEEEIIE